MQITENKRGAVTVLELDGRLDTVTSADLNKKIMSLLSNGEKYFVLDLARLTYVSSAGLRVLLMGAKNQQAPVEEWFSPTSGIWSRKSLTLPVLPIYFPSIPPRMRRSVPFSSVNLLQEPRSSSRF